MSWFAEKILGHKPDDKPHDCAVKYADGTIGRIPVYATGMREALGLVRDLMPEHKEAVELTIVVRDKA